MLFTSLCTVWVVLVAVEGAFDEPDWGEQSLLGEDYTLLCNHSSLVVQAGDTVRWELPNGSPVPAVSSKYTQHRDHGVSNIRLTIADVQEADAGIYLCRVLNGQTNRGHLLRGLNLGGPLYADLFDKYRYNLMVGGLAALIFFVPLLTVCLLYRFRYEQRHRSKSPATHNTYNSHWTKGAELDTVAVNGGEGEFNRAYNVSDDDVQGTRL